MSVNHIGGGGTTASLNIPYRVMLSDAPKLDLAYLNFEKKHWNRNRSYAQNKDEIMNLWRENITKTVNENTPYQVNPLSKMITSFAYGER